MYAADLLSHVSIPQGTIKSVFAPVTSITLLAFQFHKVRLKGKVLKALRRQIWRFNSTRYD